MAEIWREGTYAVNGDVWTLIIWVAVAVSFAYATYITVSWLMEFGSFRKETPRGGAVFLADSYQGLPPAGGIPPNFADYLR